MTNVLTAEEIDRGLLDGSLASAMFALGCFWGPDARFGSLPGVVQTRVGYAGASDLEPAYRSIKGHAEVVRVVYAPEATTYTKLLEHYVSRHTPRRIEGQYRSIIFFSSEEERAIAEHYASRYDQPPTLISTDAAEGRFWSAESYHQKYKLRRNKALASALATRLGERWDECTLATKLNALDVDGFDAREWTADLPKEIMEMNG